MTKDEFLALFATQIKTSKATTLEAVKAMIQRRKEIGYPVNDEYFNSRVGKKCLFFVDDRSSTDLMIEIKRTWDDELDALYEQFKEHELIDNTSNKDMPRFRAKAV